PSEKEDRMRTWLVIFAAALVGATSAAGLASASRSTPNRARPQATSDKVRIRFLALNLSQPAFDVLIPNFERAYPDIEVDVTYQAPLSRIFQLETIQLAAGTAPDVLWVEPASSCGGVGAVCTLASAGHLVPMGGKPWLKWSAPEVIAADKHDKVLFAYTPIVS